MSGFLVLQVVDISINKVQRFHLGVHYLFCLSVLNKFAKYNLNFDAVDLCLCNQAQIS